MSKHGTRQSRRGRGVWGAFRTPGIGWTLVGLLLTAVSAGVAWTTIRVAIAQPEVPADNEVTAATNEDEVAIPKAEHVSRDDTAPGSLFPDAAPLAIDAEVVTYLAKVDAAVAEGRELQGIRAWQTVLDGLAGVGEAASNGRLRSFRGTPVEIRSLPRRAYARYDSVRSHIEGRQRELDRDVRELHALETDGDANQLWEEFERTGQPEVLQELATRFFNGSRGDDATLRLAARALERGEAATASALLSRVLDEHPDGTEHLATAGPRLAVALARLGEVDRAVDVWERTRGGTRLPRRTVRIVERELRSAVDIPDAASTSTAWASGAGTNDGHRLAADVAAESVDSRMTEAWTLAFDVQPADVAPAGLVVGLPQDQRVAARESPTLVSGWRELQRTPVGRAVVADGRLYVRGTERVVCCDSATGRVIWMGRRNEPIIDVSSKSFGPKRVQFGELPRAPVDDEIADFCDRLSAEFAIHDDVLYALEGRVLEPGSEEEGEVVRRTTPPRRQRENVLVAYEAISGRLRWQRRADEPEAPRRDSGFLGSPAAHGELLLLPVSLGGEVWMHAVAREDGRTVWRTFVCDEPNGGSSPWSPVRVVVAGGRAYVLPGTGLVACLDATTGRVEWAARYSRSTVFDLTREERLQSKSPPFDFLGWEEETLLVHGRFLIVCPTDANRVIALDLRDGSFSWDDAGGRPRPGEPRVTRVLGIVGDGLIVGGNGLVRQYRVATGQRVWEATIDGATGSGIVTPSAVYVPVGEQIVALDPATGAVQREVSFVTPSGKPLGNLASDGERLYASGVTRVIALAPLADQLERLARRIENDDAPARLERARLLVQLDREPEAFADLLAAAEAVDEPDRPTDSALATEVLGTAAALHFDRTRPRELLATLVEGGLSRIPLSEDDESLRRDWNGLAHATLSTIARESIAGTIGDLLRVAELSGDRDVHEAIRIALTVSVRPEDLPLLSRAITEDPVSETADRPGRRTAAIHALESEQLTEVDDLLATSWDSGEPFVRLAVAETRLNRGDHAGLSGLVELLGAEELATRRRAGWLLRLATGESQGFDPRGPAEQREAAVVAWQDWLEANGVTASLTYPVGQPVLPRGRTLVPNYTRNTLTEYDASGQIVWETRWPSAFGCYGQRDGGRLVNASTGKSLVEFAPGDGEPEVRWKKENLPGWSYNVQRLPNGNVLVPYRDLHTIHEYDATGELVWEAKLAGTINDARRLDDGRTLVAWYAQNAIVELDAEGQIVPGSRIDGMSGVWSAQRLANGNTLAALYRANRVVEVDPEGQVVWSYDDLPRATFAQRVPGGNTLITHRAGVLEVRSDGRIVWQLSGPGYARVHRY